MSDNPEAAHECAAIQHVMRRFDGFTGGLGLDKATTLQIVGKVAFDMPRRTEEERMAKAYARMIVVSA